MKKRLLYIFGLIIFVAIIVFALNGLVVGKTNGRIIKEDEIKEDFDAILVLGCKVNPDGTPSMMLSNRVVKGIELYKKTGFKLILSGDHGKEEYDEVNTMKKMVLDESIPKEDVFLDHAGFSTYDSIYRAKNVFGAKKIIVISQRYHLFRALYIADKLGLDAYGVEADNIPYKMINIKNEIREVLARNKDLFKAMFKPRSKYVGETIDIKGSGEVTLDE